VQSAIIPVSLMEEEKEFLGMMSIRQVLIIGPAILLIYIWITAVPVPFLDTGTVIVIKLIVAIVMGGLAGLLAFFYSDRYEMYFDKYLRIRWGFAHSHKVYYYTLKTE
jgi:hypothetical protein